MSSALPKPSLVRYAINFLRRRDLNTPAPPPSPWWLSTQPYRKPFALTFLLTGFASGEFVVAGRHEREMSLEHRKILIMDNFIDQIKEEEVFAVAGGKGGKGKKEKQRDDLEDVVTRADVNFALYGMELDEIEGGAYEVAAEAGMAELTRRREEAKQGLRRMKEEESRTRIEPEVVEVDLETRVQDFTKMLRDDAPKTTDGDWRTRVYIAPATTARPIDLVTEPEERKKWAQQFM